MENSVNWIIFNWNKIAYKRIMVGGCPKVMSSEFLFYQIFKALNFLTPLSLTSFFNNPFTSAKEQKLFFTQMSIALATMWYNIILCKFYTNAALQKVYHEVSIWWSFMGFYADDFDEVLDAV